MARMDGIELGPDSIMIDWQRGAIFCNACGDWIDGRTVWIDGHHDIEDPANHNRSAHTVWEK